MAAYVSTQKLLNAHSAEINAIAFSPTGQYLASGADDNTLVIWTVPQAQFIFRLTFESPVDAILWHPNHSETLIIGCRDGAISQASSFDLVGSISIQWHLRTR